METLCKEHIPVVVDGIATPMYMVILKGQVDRLIFKIKQKHNVFEVVDMDLVHEYHGEKLTCKVKVKYNV